MAGGIFTTYNKVRPGAYINIKGAGASSLSSGARGGMTMPMNLGWGDENSVIRLTAADFIEGKALSTLGIDMNDEGAFLLKLALQNCSYALIYRLNSGGVAASAEIGGLDVTARYCGSFGNRIAVAVKEIGGGFNVVTYVDSMQKDSQSVSSPQSLVDNEWVIFDKTGTLQAAAAELLTGGSDGTSDTGYSKYFAAVSDFNWNTMAVPGASESDKPLIKSFIENMRESSGRKVQAVLAGYSQADYEGILSVSQGYKVRQDANSFKTVTPDMFSVYAAGLTAGAEINQSNTYHVIEDAESIINPLDDSDIEEALTEGQLVLSRRQDGRVIIEKDINTLHTFTPDKGYVFSKNRVVRCLDDIANSIRAMFENYIGKVDNSEGGRAMFKGEVIGYLTNLQNIGAVQNFDGSEDVEVKQGNDADSIIVDILVQPADAMEKLYMTVSAE